LKWRKHLSELPDKLTVNDLAESLEGPYGWTAKTFEASGLQPIRMRSPVAYSKRTLQEIRRISLAAPLDYGK